MKPDIQNKFETDWNNHFKADLEQLIPAMKISLRRALLMVALLISIFFIVGIITSEVSIILAFIAIPIGTAAILGLILYRLPKGYQDNLNIFNSNLTEKILASSEYNWLHDKNNFRDTFEMEAEFRGMFPRQSFTEVNFESLCHSTRYGAQTLTAKVTVKGTGTATYRNTQTVNDRNETGATTRQEEQVVYQGRVGMITFDKRDPLIAQGNVSNGLIDMMMKPSDLEVVDMESIDFEKKFSLYANDQQEVRQLFTPDLLHEISNWLDLAPGLITLRVNDNKIMLATSQISDLSIPLIADLDKLKNHIERNYQLIAHFDHLLARLTYHERERLDAYVA